MPGRRQHSLLAWRETRAEEKITIDRVIEDTANMYKAEKNYKHAFQKNHAREILVSNIDISPK